MTNVEYHFSSMRDLATFMRSFADRKEEVYQRARTAREKHVAKAEQRAWLAAADLVEHAFIDDQPAQTA